MNIWKSKKWKDYYINCIARAGAKIDFDKGVDIEVKNAIKNMVA